MKKGAIIAIVSASVLVVGGGIGLFLYKRKNRKVVATASGAAFMTGIGDGEWAIDFKAGDILGKYIRTYNNALDQNKLSKEFILDPAWGYEAGRTATVLDGSAKISW